MGDGKGIEDSFGDWTGSWLEAPKAELLKTYEYRNYDNNMYSSHISN